MKALSVTIRALLFGGPVIVLFFNGCGGDTSQQQAGVLEVPPTPTAVETRSRRPEEREIDFASLERFPDLRFSVSADLFPNGDKRCPLLPDNVLRNATGEILTGYWAAPVPASYEISLPPGAVIRRIEVLGLGGTLGIPECVVFIRKTPEGSWKRPAGLRYRKVRRGTDEDGERMNHIFSFEKTPAVGVMIGFAVGCERYPDQTQVKNISIFGELNTDE